MLKLFPARGGKQFFWAYDWSGNIREFATVVAQQVWRAISLLHNQKYSNCLN